ncbi:hypothetical protein [Spirosoma koreense]
MFIQKYKSAVCWILIAVSFACQDKKQSAENTPTPDAVRDLLIDRSFWNRTPADSAHKELVNTHRLTITNTSHDYAYRQIEVRFDYYDRNQHRIDSAMHVVNRTIEPRAAITIGALKLNPAKEATATATATIVKAVAESPSVTQ